MKIVQLKVSNVQRVVAAYIDHPGDIVVLGGDNTQGKTSLLDALEMALGGAEAVPDMPLRKGAEKGYTICKLVDLDESGNEIPETAIVAERRFKQGGKKKGDFVLRSADGTPQKEPQRMLNTLIGRKAFDPLAFERMKPADQFEALKNLIGLDLGSLDARYDRAYEGRKRHNASVNTLATQVRALSFHDDAPDEEVSIAALTEELTAAQEEQERIAEMQRQRINLTGRVTRTIEAREVIRVKIQKFKERIEVMEREVQSETTIIEREQSHTVELEAAIIAAQNRAPEVEPIRQRLTSAEEINRMVRENAEVSRLGAAFRTAEDYAEKWQQAIDKVAQERREMIAAAEMPVEGLSLNAGQVLLDGVPLEQASTAELRRLSIAMGFALNPKLPLVLIRDASLFDERSYKMVCQMAAERKGLLWMERVAVDGKTTIEIREGKIVEKGTGDDEENAENS